MATLTVKYKAFSTSLQVHLVKDKTINELKVTKAQLKLVTYMNNDNVHYHFVAVVFIISTKLGGIGPKA